MNHQFDVIVIGAGIAGLSAAREAARSGLSTLALTGQTLGGHLVSIESVENWPPQPEGIPGYDLCPIAQEEAADAGAQFEMVEADSIAPDGELWRLAAGGAEYAARAIILATGTTMKKLGVPGEARFEGRGVSQCASCDAPLLRGKDVVVVGGGDSALQETLSLLDHAAKIVIVTRGDALRAQSHFLHKVVGHPKVEIRTGTTISEILGDDVVTGVRLAPGGLLACAAAFVFIGLTPHSTLAAGLAAADASGAILTDAAMRTSARGLFAAGTVRSGAAFRAAESAADGVAAARAAHGYLLDGAWPSAAQ